MKVFKYPLKVEDEQTVDMPAGAKILTVQVQGATPCLWVLVDEGKAMEARKIVTVGTGHPADHCAYPNCRYIGTYQLERGALVFHVFEKTMYEKTN